MARPKKENTRKSIFGTKLETLVSDRKNTRLSEYFKVGMTALSKYLNGDSTPSMEKLQEFVLNYAAANKMQLIDLNWLMSDHDRRPGPIFVGYQKESASNQVAEPEDPPASLESATAPADMPPPNALLPVNIDAEKPVQHFPALGKAVAKDRFNGNRGGFSEDQYVVWDDITDDRPDPAIRGRVFESIKTRETT